MTTFKRFTKVSDPCDPVEIYATEDGLLKIYKRPHHVGYTLKRFSLFDQLGTTLGRYASLESAIYAAQKF